MISRVLVTGAQGQLGRSILKLVALYKTLDFTFVTRKELDLSDSCSIENYFRNNEFDVVINCAAYTLVDKAESDLYTANQVNHLGVKKIAEICKSKAIYLIHISTDYVFNGENSEAYKETDSTDPRTVYGKTKLNGEQALQKVNPGGMIIRTSWLYSEFGNNFVKTMLRLSKERDVLDIVYDQVGSPTYASDLASAILNIIAYSEFKGIESGVSVYHYSNEGSTNWCDFAKTIFSICGLECQVRPVESKDYPVLAERPHYSLLDKRKIKQRFNVEVPFWEDSLATCLRMLTN